MTIFEVFRSLRREFVNQAIEVIINADDYEALRIRAMAERGGLQSLTEYWLLGALYGIPVIAAPNDTLERGHGLLVSGGEVMRHLEWDAPEHEEPRTAADWIDELRKAEEERLRPPKRRISFLKGTSV